jgi:hypothetical protein
MANFFDALREKSIPVKVKIEEEWLLYSLDEKRSEEILSFLVDEEDNGYHITLLRRNGITAAERKKCGETYKRQEETRRQYDSLLQACARLHQVPEADISMLINVQLRSEIVKMLVERDKAEGLATTEEDKITVKNRNLVGLLGEDFKKLCDLKNAADEAFLDYRYELGAYILSSPLRVQNLVNAKTTKFKPITKEELRNLDQNLVNRIYLEFINKEEGGRDAWDNITRKSFTAKWDGEKLTPAEGIELREDAIYEIEAKETIIPADMDEDDDEGKTKAGD